MYQKHAGGRLFHNKDLPLAVSLVCGSGWDAYDSDDQYEFETSFTLHPAQWLLRCGVNLGVRVAVARSTQGWKQKLETYRAVPDDSLIFDYCIEGNLDGVRSLFSSGRASPYDTGSGGLTPLHVHDPSPSSSYLTRAAKCIIF